MRGWRIERSMSASYLLLYLLVRTADGRKLRLNHIDTATVVKYSLRVIGRRVRCVRHTARPLDFGAAS